MSPRSTSRRKKRRYLSLRRRLAAATPMESSVPSPSITSDRVQLDLFPLHPSMTPVEDDPQDEHLSRFFPSDDAFSLHSLLGPNSTSTSSSAFVSEDQLSAPSSSSANYSACSSSYAVVGLARAALRGRERWWAEEEDQEGEAASGGATGLLSKSARRLSLKLDYDAILNDWSGNRPLFVDEDDDGLQVVPDLGRRHAAIPVPYDTTVFVDVAGCHGGGEPSGFCTVPAVDGGGNGEAPAADGGKCGSSEGGKPVAEEEEEDDDDGKEATAVAVGREEREARVMRYKEKRRHRLFSKRIRYEVRKLNAEKRPRSKGRFVKRDGDIVAGFEPLTSWC